MNERDIIKKMRADSFVRNNGTVLRAINVLRTKYNRLDSLSEAIGSKIGSADFADCINYLSEAGYITLRRCDSKAPANIADDDIDEIEAKVSAEGIRLLNGKVSDPCIEV